MLSAIYFLIILGLAVVSLTRRRVFVLCGFLSVYGVLKVLALGDVMDWNQLVAFQALYGILLVSLVARVIQDRNFFLQIRLWPLLPYFFLVALLLVSSLYSPSNRPFSPDRAYNLWGRLAILSLFWLTASQVQRKNDLKIIVSTSIAVSLGLSVWVIWNAAQMNFEALRGGVEVNQNFVSLFVLAGAIPMVHSALTEKRLVPKLFALSLLLCVVLGSLILASRGIFAAFALAMLFMFGQVLRGRGYRVILGAGTALVVVFAVALVLPGGGSLLSRFQEERVGTLNERTDIWAHSFRYFADSGPARMVFGQGLSSGSFVIRPALPDYENYHNEYLTWLMDQGVVGLAAFVVFLYAVARRVMKSDHPLKNVMIGWLVFLSAAGFSSTISDQHLFWILLGTIVGASSWADNSGSSLQPVPRPVPQIPSSVVRGDEAFGGNKKPDWGRI